MIDGKKKRWHISKDDILSLDTVTYTNVAVAKLRPLPNICEPNSSIANHFVEIFDNDGKQLEEIPMAEIDSEASIGKFAVDASNTIYLVIAKTEKVEVEEQVKEEVPDNSIPMTELQPAVKNDSKVEGKEAGTQTEDEKNKAKEDSGKGVTAEHDTSKDNEHTEIVAKSRSVEAPTVSQLSATVISPEGEVKTKTIIKTVKKIVAKPLSLTLEEIKKRFQYFDVIYRLKDSVKVVEGEFLLTVYDNLKDFYIYKSLPVDEAKMMTLMKTLISSSDTSSMGLLEFYTEPLLTE
ncbi:phage morphogenesis protein [Clostridium botulinum]|uniref:phage morphogenesis protein n=1 Tax=Clostridium botulinum TaxID=1491 RepID=UPI00099243B3|nr:phage morphogenesis protein [Clostridium botulinum]NFO98108.1 phage morphogenesis protein [Clostridium botulinum]OOV53103.1 phage morphogenesis protein [Clostridium botulinum D/C]OOV58329.1 phage morphogenesis protein [Clostridium botulinum D/C]OOV59608.1 phage morphogenesis protein [Clostridium botulinum D/C]